MIDTLGKVGDFIGGFGVVVTVIYLAIRIRRSMKASRAEMTMDLYLAILEQGRFVSWKACSASS